MAVVSSSAGLLSLLSEDDEHLKLYALQHLNAVVHQFWFQISTSITSVEQLYEDPKFSHRKLAALVASKVYYYLGELKDALDYALGAEELFDIEDRSQYNATLLSWALDAYFENRHAEKESDPRLVAVVERLLDRCVRENQEKQAIGLALEGRRLDVVRRICEEAADPKKLLAYGLTVCSGSVLAQGFKFDVLQLLVELYQKLDRPDWSSVSRCLALLKQPQDLAKILIGLLKGSVDDALLAFQIGFDLVENEVQRFVQRVGESMEGAAREGEVEIEEKRLESMKAIVSGKATIKLHMDFLYSHNHADLQLLKNVKAVIDTRQSVCHSATVFANAIMHCGTTVDTFLRDNLEWLGRATNWAKFSATAGLGVIHKGHLENSQALMSPYLPPNDGSGSPYSEGGALFALGLIHANHGHGIQEFLLSSLRDARNEVIQHGACLALGIAALGTESPEINELVRNTLSADSAVAGEAAGIALGLINAGSASEIVSDLLVDAHDTQHEKIIRGIAIGLAIVMYGQEENAESLIEQMTTDQDPILRYAGMYVIGLAYAGTDNNQAIQKLLHFAVSDVSDDVRRAAVLCLGFVLLGQPDRCPRMVSLLSESYNPHVRYGAAMAMGIACGGTGLKEAQNLLQPMLSDPVDVVRQGALIAMALILVQSPEIQIGGFRKNLEKFVGDKTEETMCRMGAIMAAGILDAGGRNLTIGCRSASGDILKRGAVIGLALFTQYWYWYPLSYFLSLVFTPAALIGLNVDLELPKFSVRCNCKPSMFGYPAALVEESGERAGKKLPTAVLSTTERAKERAKRREQDKRGRDAGPSTVPMQVDKPSSPKSRKEPDFHFIDNAARVVPQQEAFIEFSDAGRWIPIRPGVKSGIVMLKDSTPDAPFETTGSGVHAKKEEVGEAATEGDRMDIDTPAQPEPFEYVFDD